MFPFFFFRAFSWIQLGPFAPWVPSPRVFLTSLWALKRSFSIILFFFLVFYQPSFLHLFCFSFNTHSIFPCALVLVLLYSLTFFTITLFYLNFLWKQFLMVYVIIFFKTLVFLSIKKRSNYNTVFYVFFNWVDFVSLLSSVLIKSINLSTQPITSLKAVILWWLMSRKLWSNFVFSYCFQLAKTQHFCLMNHKQILFKTLNTCSSKTL